MNLSGWISYCRHHYRVTVVTAYLKAALSGQRLPPGKFVLLDPAERLDQQYLLRHTAKVGPLFKAVFDGKLCVCVIGLPLCRRFLQEHAANITAQTIKLDELVPGGFMRGMHGNVHKKYRKALIRALDTGVLLKQSDLFKQTIAQGLARYSQAQQDGMSPPHIYVEALNGISSRLLIYIFFGAHPTSAPAQVLMKMYNTLGPKGLVWNVDEQQRKAYREIRGYLIEQLKASEDNDAHWIKNSIIGRMCGDGALDETNLGNLIYMVEMGRYDTRLLFRWLSKYGSENPALLDRISAETEDEGVHKITLSKAFVMETLRLNQSERLMRIVNRNIVFDGYTIPRNFSIRLCLWESHKLSESFAEPFRFRPERFIEEIVGSGQYSPFGLHQHNCPFADISMRLSALFIRILARHYRVDPVADGPAVRGEFHWQPANTFSVRLTER